MCSQLRRGAMPFLWSFVLGLAQTSSTLIDWDILKEALLFFTWAIEYCNIFIMCSKAQDHLPDPASSADYNSLLLLLIIRYWQWVDYNLISTFMNFHFSLKESFSYSNNKMCSEFLNASMAECNKTEGKRETSQKAREQKRNEKQNDEKCVF